MSSVSLGMRVMFGAGRGVTFVFVVGVGGGWGLCGLGWCVGRGVLVEWRLCTIVRVGGRWDME